jgi:hypothetical protein
VAIENLPSQAWNLEGLNKVLGEVCLMDKIDRVTYRQEASDIIFCWAWMWFPDLLPRAKTITFFEHGAGRALPFVDEPQRPREVAAPPKGMIYNLIVHLDVVEDWNPPRVRTPSSGQSGIPSSVSSEEEEYPRIYNFEWTAGVLDGLRARHGPASPAVCRPQPGAHRRDNNDDGDDNGPRPPPRGLL